MEFSFYVPTKIMGGNGCVRANTKVFKEMGKRALIITGASSAKASGALDDVIDSLDEHKIGYTVFNEVRENPLLSTVAKAGRIARDMKADFIIAIGGGSVLDAARAASVFAASDIEPWENVYKGAFTAHLPFVCIGTSAGTGSEIDNVAVITEDATGHKKSIKKDFLFAEYAFCDYNYTKSMNLRQTVSTALDALCHCFEGWFNTAATEPVVCAARRGAELIYPWLKKITAGNFDADSDEMRRDLYYGSLWGGITITHAGTGFPHPAGYILTERGGIPHGIACAVFEPAFMRHTIPNLDIKDLKMLNAIIGSEAELIETIEQLCKNNIKVTKEVCDDIVQRLAGSPHVGKALGEYTLEMARCEIESLFLRSGQKEDIAGQWLFGRSESGQC